MTEGAGVVLKAGDVLPTIRGETPEGPLDLGDFRGSKAVVIWTYPKDGTSG